MVFPHLMHAQKIDIKGVWSHMGAMPTLIIVHCLLIRSRIGPPSTLLPSIAPIM